VRSLFLGLFGSLTAANLMAAVSEPSSEAADGSAFITQATYTGELWRQASGGIAVGNRYLDNLDLTMDVDAERAFGAKGLRFFGYVLANNGHTLCADLTGSAQCVSNIESVEALRLYELWADWKFGDQHSLRFGLYDLNSEFDAIDTAALFITPSHGIGPDFSQSGGNGPSIFPVTSLALRATTSHGPWSAQFAVLDGVPGDPEHPKHTAIKLSSEDGALLIGEVNYRFKSGARIGGGYWHYTADFDDLTAVDEDGNALTRSDNTGAYLMFESPVFFKNSDETGLNLFARLGEAEAHINPIEHYVGAGAVYTNMSKSGLPRQLGLGVAIAELGTPFRSTQADVGVDTTQRETNWELTYRFGVNDWFTLQSDVQYIQDPGMDPTRQSSWTVGLRFEITRGWAW
jgi:porin